MAAGTVTDIGPFKPDDFTIISTDLTTEAGAIIKSVTSWQDQENKFVWFAVTTEA